MLVLHKLQELNLVQSNIAPHANFNKMNGVIPGEGLTKPPGAAPYQQPPQFVHLDDLLETMWNKMHEPENTAQIYGFLKLGIPAEAIARVLLFGAFSHGVCTPDLAILALKTVVRQVAALGTFLGLKNIKIKNHNPATVKQLATIARALDEFGPASANDKTSDTDSMSTPNSSGSAMFTGLGV